MNAKLILAVLAAAFVGTAHADMVMPEEFHRIGYEVLVSAAGAAALGGGLLRKLRNISKTDETPRWKCEDEISETERDDFARRIDANLPDVQKAYDKAYESVFDAWMEDDKKRHRCFTVSCWVHRQREHVWMGLQEQLLMDVLAQDDDLRARFVGIPIELLRNRLAKPMPSDFTAGVFSEEGLCKIDQYGIISELGTGGFGSVYLARDTVSRTFVTVKGLPALVKNNAEEMKRIQENFALVSRLLHPNIAAALVLYPADRVSYPDPTAAEKLNVKPGDTLIVMEYAPGVTLTKWRRQFPDNRVPMDKVIEIAKQVASALDYAHAQKIIHRDLNPSHIMVETKADGGLTVRVLDFGFSAQMRDLAAKFSDCVGCASGARPYLSPEQWKGETTCSATDQYALGVITYEMIAGALPNHDVIDRGLCDNFTDKVPPIDTVAPYVNDALARAMARAPNERFVNCTEFVSALENKSGIGFLARCWQLFKGGKP